MAQEYGERWQMGVHVKIRKVILWSFQACGGVILVTVERVSVLLYSRSYLDSATVSPQAHIMRPNQRPQPVCLQ